MKHAKINYHIAQLAKISLALGVPATTDPQNIPKPYGMRTTRYEILLKRYEKHRNATVKLTREGMMKWYKRTYSARIAFIFAL